jgi:large subunit ribosomal protein L7/L12
MADVKALAEQLVSLSVKDVQELANVLKSDYGIEPKLLHRLKKHLST